LPEFLSGKNLGKYKFSDIDEMMAVNFNCQAKLILKILLMLISRSRLLLFSSIFAQRGSFDSIYAASKGPAFACHVACHRAAHGARINSIEPGLIQDSAMFIEMTPERQAYHRSQIPLQAATALTRFGQDRL
jgi:NAD(P)-dependent dehydrogenase (short-subunit alcohol dehydrogenase family)